MPAVSVSTVIDKKTAAAVKLVRMPRDLAVASRSERNVSSASVSRLS